MGRIRSRGIRGQWSEEDLTQALQAVNAGMSVNRASTTYNLPRRTLRRYVEQGKTGKAAMGRKPILTQEQEAELSRRIIRLSEVGYPLTASVLRRCVYRYTKLNNIPNPFREEKEKAGRYWLKGFMERNPQIRVRRAQNLNPARAQKLNKLIVNDHFTKLEEVLRSLHIMEHPERIYNIDEKGCRLCLHHQQKVLAAKGSRRVHLVTNEHAQNVSIVACGNAIGTAIPPVILFKGKRMKQEWSDSMPAGTSVLMTEKGSMTQAAFSRWIEHFAKFKVQGQCLLIFDGAKCHLDYSILETAERFDITLYCLPSNTTHELQPMDKAVFRAFEYYWDDEVVKYFSTHPDERSISKMRFGGIFSAVWDKTMTMSNIKAGFRATGIYPLNREAIPEIAFAPSTASQNQDQEPQQQQQMSQETVPSNTSGLLENKENNVDRSISLEAGPSTSGVRSQKKNGTRARTCTHDDSSSDSDSHFSVHDESSNSYSDEEIVQDPALNENNSFTEMLPTPDMVLTKAKKPRKPALNSRAQVVTRNLFTKENKILKDISVSSTNIKKKSKISRAPKPQCKILNESWYCKLCREDRQADMRLCVKCKAYVHEECMGLTKDDVIEIFMCPDCG